MKIAPARSADEKNILAGPFDVIKPLVEPSMIAKNVIGSGTHFLSGPFGSKPITYADSTASGKSLKFIEKYISDVVLPLYANTHTEASATGLQTSRFRQQARNAIKEALNAPDEEYAVIFTGSGVTAAVDKLSRMLGFYQQHHKIGDQEKGGRDHVVTQKLPAPTGRTLSRQPSFSKSTGQSIVPPRRGVHDPPVNSATFEKDSEQEQDQPVVFIGPYEHHSNEVLWRETQAKVVVIPEDPKTGSIDHDELEKQLKNHSKHKLKVGSFSAASNVTGIRSDTKLLTYILHRNGALACFDFAAAGPHGVMDIGGDNMDAAYLSVHKFVGGPQTPGILVVRRSLFDTKVANLPPTVPGGGTVVYVQPSNGHGYHTDIEHREEGGTPSIVESIRAGLVLKLHAKVGGEVIEKIEGEYLERAIAAWAKNPNLTVLGNSRAKRVSIVSFTIKEPFGGTNSLHYNFVTTLLNDLFGIQSRGGCACAGPYGHALFNIDQKRSNEILEAVKTDGEVIKPGWTRVAFSYYMSVETVDYIIEAIDIIAKEGYKLLPWYKLDSATGMWTNVNGGQTTVEPLDLWDFDGMKRGYEKPDKVVKKDLAKCMKNAKRVLKAFGNIAPPSGSATELKEATKRLRWFSLPEEARLWVASDPTEAGRNASWTSTFDGDDWRIRLFGANLIHCGGEQRRDGPGDIEAPSFPSPPAIQETEAVCDTWSYDYIAVFFGAMYCPSCRNFAPVVAKCLDTLETKKRCKVVFVSNDRTQEEFHESCNKLVAAAGGSGIHAMPYNLKRTAQMRDLFQLATIPALMILRNDSHASSPIVVSNARHDLEKDREAKHFPWNSTVINPNNDHVSLQWPKLSKMERFFIQGRYGNFWEFGHRVNPLEPDKIYVDENAVRARAGLLNVMSWFCIMNVFFWRSDLICNVFIPIAGFEFGSSVLTGLTPFSPFGVLGTIIAMALYDEPSWGPAKPKRFAWSIGLFLVLLCALWWFVLGRETLGDAFRPLLIATVMFCQVATWLEASVGFCIGCYIYNSFVVPTFKLDVCEECKFQSSPQHEQ